MSTTAKVVVDACDDLGQGTCNVHMFADYTSDVNKEWADATPSLGLSMNVKNEVAEEFYKVGNRLTITFEVDSVEGDTDATEESTPVDDGSSSDG